MFYISVLKYIFIFLGGKSKMTEWTVLIMKKKDSLKKKKRNSWKNLVQHNLLLLLLFIIIIIILNILTWFSQHTETY